MGRSQAVMAAQFSLPTLLATDLFPPEKTLVATVDTTPVFLVTSQARVGGGGGGAACGSPLSNELISSQKETLLAIINTTLVLFPNGITGAGGGTACEYTRGIFAQSLVILCVGCCTCDHSPKLSKPFRLHCSRFIIVQRTLTIRAASCNSLTRCT